MDACIDQLYRRHHALLVRFLTRLTRSPERAEDLAQAAWLKLLCARGRGICAGGEEAELRAYLFTIARNAFLDEYTRKHGIVRTRVVDPALLETLIDASASCVGPEQEAERCQEHGLLRGAVADLPAEQRRIILMWSRGASIREMASASGAPRDTVLSRKKYAVARLRGTIGATLGSTA